MKQQSFLWIIAGLSLVGAALLGWLIDNFGALGAVVGLGAAMAVWLGTAITANPQLGLWLILFFLPFERIPSFDVGGITLRLNFFFGAVTLAAAIGAWVFGTLKGRPNPIIWPLLLYFLAAIVGISGAIEQDRAIQVLIFTLFTSAFCWAVINLLRTAQDLKAAMRILLTSSLIVGVFGMYQFMGDAIGLPTTLTGLDQGYTKEVLGFPRVQAFSIEPLYLGNYLLLPLSLLFALLMNRVTLWPRWLLWSLFGLLALILILTVSRGAYLGAAATVAVLVMTLPRETFHPKHLMIGLILLGMVGVGTGYFIAQGREDAIEQFQEHVTIGDLYEGESTQGRLKAFGQAFEAWQDHPLLGIGLGNFGAYVKGYPDPRELEGYDIVNNEYLEVLAETGLAGFATLGVLIIYLLARSVIAYTVARDPLVRSALVATTAAFVGLLVQYNFFSTLFIIHVWVLIGLMVASQNLVLEPQKQQAKQ